MNSPSVIVSVVTIGLAAAACATGTRPTTLPAHQVVLESGPNLRIMSAHLGPRGDAATLWGQVRRDRSSPGAARGHLHVTVLGSSGVVVARRTVHWSNTQRRRHPVPMSYRADLGVPRAVVTGVKITFAPEGHASMEGFR